jgi:hypothetical protein
MTMLLFALLVAQEPQNPSPMVEHTRPHPRRTKQSPPGKRIGSLFLPEKLKLHSPVPLLVFFHGGDWLPEVAAARHGRMAVLTQPATMKDPTKLAGLLTEAESAAGVKFAPLILGGWSAGCGAIRELLKSPELYERTRALVLIDGIHTDYINGKPGPVESAINTEKLEVWARFAREAVAGRRHMLVTHSEIFPGTFASTTETADWLLSTLGIPRRAVLRWGPVRTQQLSEARAGRFLLIGYAGNTAPDHVDQLHSLPEYLDLLKNLGAADERR